MEQRETPEMGTSVEERPPESAGNTGTQVKRTRLLLELGALAVLVIVAVTTAFFTRVRQGEDTLYPDASLETNTLSDHALDDRGSATSLIQWTPASLSIDEGVGQSTTTTVTFVAAEDMTDVMLSVSPELAEYVTASPAMFGHIKKGEEVLISIIPTTIAGDGVGTHEGAIQMHAGSEGKVYGESLPIKLCLGTLFQDKEHGFLIYYPSNFDSLTSPARQPALLAHNDFTGPSGAPIVSVSVYQNAARVPIAEWYEETLSDKEYSIADSPLREVSKVVIAGVPSLRVQSNIMGNTMIRTYIPNGVYVIGVDTSVSDTEPVPQVYYEMLRTFSPLESVGGVWHSFESKATGVSFQYPDFGQPITAVEQVSSDGVTTYDFGIPVQEDDGGVSNAAQYAMVLRPNTTLQSLHHWFEERVDKNGVLLASGTFVFTTLDNGVEAYVLRKGVPNEYDGPPIPGTIYAISPDHMKLIVIFKSQDHSLGVVDAGVITDSLLDMLGTLSDGSGTRMVVGNGAFSFVVPPWMEVREFLENPSYQQIYVGVPGTYENEAHGSFALVFHIYDLQSNSDLPPGAKVRDLVSLFTANDPDTPVTEETIGGHQYLVYFDNFTEDTLFATQLDPTHVLVASGSATSQYSLSDAEIRSILSTLIFPAS